MVYFLKGRLKEFSVAVLILLSFLIYSPSLRIPFINDEIASIQRNEIPSLKNSPSLFEKKDYDGYYYRPQPDFITKSFLSGFSYTISVIAGKDRIQ